MRLYLKLFVIVAAAAGAQWALKANVAPDVWFAARCHFAYVTGDDAMRERLVRECQQLIYCGPYDAECVDHVNAGSIGE